MVSRNWRSPAPPRNVTEVGVRTTIVIVAGGAFTCSGITACGGAGDEGATTSDDSPVVAGVGDEALFPFFGAIHGHSQHTTYFENTHRITYDTPWQ